MSERIDFLQQIARIVVGIVRGTCIGMDAPCHPAQHVVAVGGGKPLRVEDGIQLAEVVIMHPGDAARCVGHLYLPALIVCILCGDVAVGVGDGGDKTAMPAPVDVYPDQRHGMEHPPGR